MFKISMRQEWCKGCNLCLAICPRKVFKISDFLSEKGFKMIIPEKEKECIGCMLCELLCPDLVITVESEIGESLPQGGGRDGKD